MQKLLSFFQQKIFSVFGDKVIKHLTNKHLDLGPVVQSIVSLTSLLRGQLVKCFTTFQPNTLKFFVKKMREACAKASHIFSTKNIGIFEILMFEILTRNVN